MSTDLTDLRRTLAAHADDADDADGELAPVERIHAVHSRVRGVRRRRQAAVALTAVVVLGAGGLAFRSVAREAQEARRPIIGGHVAPATMTSLGYGYTFQTARTSDREVTVRLDAASRPRLVSWAGSAGTVRLSSDDGLYAGMDTSLTPGSADFSDFVYVPADTPERFTVRGAGRVSLAVYELSTRAPGVTQRGVTWRTQVAGGQLLSSVTGATGASSVTGTLTLPAAGGGLSFYAACAGAPAHSGIEVSVEGRPVFSGGQCDQPSLGWDGADAGAYGTDTTAFGRPGATVSYTVRLVDQVGEGQRPLDGGSGVRLAAGIYQDPPATAHVGTTALAPVIEQAGHTWRLQHVTRSRPGSRTLSTGLDADAVPVLVRTITNDTLPGHTTTVLGGRVVGSSGDSRAGGGSEETVATLINQSVSAEVRVTRAGPHTLLALATYVEADHP